MRLPVHEAGVPALPVDLPTRQYLLALPEGPPLDMPVATCMTVQALNELLAVVLAQRPITVAEREEVRKQTGWLTWCAAVAAVDRDTK